MARKRHKPEAISAKPKKADLMVSQGRSVEDAVRFTRAFSAFLAKALKP
jgi:hypothetical protein